MPFGIGYPPGYETMYGMRPGQGVSVPGLLAGAQRSPGLLEAPAPQPSPGRWGSFKDALGQIFGGQNDPRLTKEENDRARKQALMQAGLATILSSGPSPVRPGLMQALAAGAMQGQGVGAQVRAGMGQRGIDLRSLEGVLTPEQMAMVRTLPPEAQQEVLAKLATQQGPEAKVVGQGASLVGPDGRLIFQSPERPDEEFAGLPSEIKAALFAKGITSTAQLDPQSRALVFEMAERYRRANAPTTTTNVNLPPVERAQVGALMGQYEQAITQATEAQNRIASLDAMESLLQGGMDTGAMQNLTVGLRGVAADLGVANAENLGRQELFRALSNKIALEMKGNLTGQMSDRDIVFLQNQAPQLANTEAGNRLLIDVLRRAAERQVEKAVAFDRYLAENGSPVGWVSFWNDYVKRNPVSGSSFYGGKLDVNPRG